MKKRVLMLVAAGLLAGSLYAEVTVKSVKGTAGVLEGKRLAPLSVGMSLKDDATVVTGAASEVTLEINNGLVTFKALTTARIGGVKRTETESKAAVALKTGTVVSEVKQIKGLKTSFTVTTPVGTSSVRGTVHTVSYGPERGMAVSVASGVVEVSSARGGSRPVAAGAAYAQPAGAAPPRVETQAAQAAAEAAKPSATTAFAPPEEAAQATSNGDSEPSALAGLESLLPTGSDTGTVNVSVVFP